LTFSTFKSEYYIWSVKWLRDDRIIVVYVNREQNRANTVINDATTGNVLLSKVKILN
jgi:hypothetical protein